MAGAKDWQKLEHLVAEIQARLAPGAKVTHNAKFPVYESETLRLDAARL
ncbi:hypothetical protein [Cupriavidus sp. L7L]|nr:hypothetical protein [Cupriavidus sp. L7L]